MIELHSEVKDIITGFKGIVTGKTTWANGCVRYAIQGKMDKDGKVPDLQWADEQDVIEIKEPVKKKKLNLGGPQGDPSRNADPKR